MAPPSIRLSFPFFYLKCDDAVTAIVGRYGTLVWVADPVGRFLASQNRHVDYFDVPFLVDIVVGYCATIHLNKRIWTTKCLRNQDVSGSNEVKDERCRKFCIFVITLIGFFLKARRYVQILPIFPGLGLKFLGSQQGIYYPVRSHYGQVMWWIMVGCHSFSSNSLWVKV